MELVFDPFDLTVLFVRRDGKDAGTATPHHITRHSHPKARPEDPGSGDDAPRATGVDYIALLGEQHDRQKERSRSTTTPSSRPDGGDSDPPASGQQERGRRRGAGEEDGRG